MNENEEILFTPVALLDLLLQIDELQDYNLGLSETPTGFKLQVGDSIYNIENKTNAIIKVDEEIVDEISTLSEIAYENLLDETADLSEIGDPNIYEDIPIEGGLIKEAVKSLFLGGLIKFAKNHLL